MLKTRYDGPVELWKTLKTGIPAESRGEVIHIWMWKEKGAESRGTNPLLGSGILYHGCS